MPLLNCIQWNMSLIGFHMKLERCRGKVWSYTLLYWIKMMSLCSSEVVPNHNTAIIIFCINILCLSFFPKGSLPIQVSVIYFFLLLSNNPDCLDFLLPPFCIPKNKFHQRNASESSLLCVY